MTHTAAHPGLFGLFWAYIFIVRSICESPQVVGLQAFARWWISAGFGPSKAEEVT